MTTTFDAMVSALDRTESALVSKPRFEDGTTYAGMLMKHYPERVLRFLETMSDDELQQKVGKASEEEQDKAWHDMMIRETDQHGCD